MKLLVLIACTCLGSSQALDSFALRRSKPSVKAHQPTPQPPAPTTPPLHGVGLTFEVANYEYEHVQECFADTMRKEIVQAVATAVKAAMEKASPPLAGPLETYVQIFSGDSKIVTYTNTSAANVSLLEIEDSSAVVVSEADAGQSEKQCSCRLASPHAALIQAENQSQNVSTDVAYGTKVEVFMTIASSAAAPAAAPPAAKAGIAPPTAAAAPAAAPQAPVPPVGPPGGLSLLNRRKPVAPKIAKHPLEAIVNGALQNGSIKTCVEAALYKASCVFPLLSPARVASKEVIEFDVSGCATHMSRIAKLFAQAYTPRLVPPAILNECSNYLVKATFNRDELIEAEDKAKCKLITEKFARQWSHGNYPQAMTPAAQSPQKKLSDYDFTGFCQDICITKYGPVAAQCRLFNGWR